MTESTQPVSVVSGTVTLAAAVTLGRDSLITVQATGTRTTPTAGQVITTITPGLNGQWEITGTMTITGTTVVAAETNNIALNKNAVALLSPLIIVVPGTTGETIPWSIGPVVVNLVPSDTINVTAIALATTGAVYTATLIARKVV
jgi:hypothetical protein